MPDNESFVHDYLLPDSNTRRCHVGDACQWAPPQAEGEVSPEVAAMIAAHRATIHAPGSRAGSPWGYDEDGNPIETSYLGLGLDPETGETFPLDAEGNRVGGEPIVTEATPAPAPAPAPAPSTSTRTTSTSTPPSTG